MRILFVLNGYLPTSVAGTEIYVSRLAEELTAAGVEVEVVIPNIGCSKLEHYFYKGIKVYKYPETSKVDRKLILGFSKPSGLSHFRNLLSDTKYDVIHFHEIAGSNGITLHHIKIAKELNKKIVYTFHLSNLTCNNGTLIRFDRKMCSGQINQKFCSVCLNNKQIPSVKVSKFLSFVSIFLYNLKINPLRLNSKFSTAFSGAHLIEKMKGNFIELVDAVNHIVVLTEWYRNVLLLNGAPATKISLFPQGVTNAIIPSENISQYTLKQKLKLLFVGRISHFKGLHLLIDALKGVDTNLVELTIYGKPDDTLYANELIARTKSNPSIIWAGIIDNSKIIEVMQEHHLLCLCSTFSEMSALVIQEAFAAKLPVLASDVIGNREIIKQNENGLLFKLNSIDSLREELIKILKNPNILSSIRSNLKHSRTFIDIAREHKSLYNYLISKDSAS